MKNNDTERRNSQKRRTFFFRGNGLGCRRVLNIMVFLGFMVNYMLRVNLTFAIVYMCFQKNDTLIISQNQTIKNAFDTADIDLQNSELNAQISESGSQNLSSLQLLPFSAQNYSTKFNQTRGESNIQNFTDGFANNNDRIGNSNFFNNSEVSSRSSQDGMFFNNTGKGILESYQQINGSDSSQYGKAATPIATEKPYDIIKGYNKFWNRFNWNEQEQGLLLGSFFWGYVCTELPGGRLAELIGARSVFGYATLGASVVTLFTPLSSKIDLIAVSILRIILGLLLGPTWPSVLPLASKWIPPNERGKFMSNMMASTLGAAFTLPLSSFIIESSSWEYVFYITGLVGLVWSVFWFALVFDSPAQHPRITSEERRYIETQLGLKSSPLLNSDRSETSLCISDRKERGVIENQNVIESNVDTSDEDEKKCEVIIEMRSKNNNESSENESESAPERTVAPGTGTTDAAGSSSTSKNGKIAESPVKSVSVASLRRNGSLSPTERKNSSISHQIHIDAPPEQNSGHGHGNAPWLHIITSVPVWAFVITHTASVYGYNTITVQLPTYMKHILDYDIKTNGILSSLPYLGKYIMAITAGSIADVVLRSKKFSKTGTKKLFTALGVMIPGFLMLLQVWLGHDKIFSVVIFTTALTMNGFVTGGYLGNSLDLAPNYSGTVFGLANMFSSAGGAFSALIVGYLTNKNQVYSQWQKVFWIVGGMYLVGATTFLIFGTTDVQPWNNSNKRTTSKTSKVDIDDDDAKKEAEPLKILKS